MYLEERVGQLENLSVDHGRQIEIIAKGVADLTVTVNERFDQVINEMNQRFNQVDQRFAEVDRQFDKVDRRFDKVDRRFDKVNEDIAELKTGQIRLETTVTDIQQTQQLILTLLQDRLK
ncbi:hypothetical protein BH09BAC4_BH09BAC4_47550 [soil metagenome]